MYVYCTMKRQTQYRGVKVPFCAYMCPFNVHRVHLPAEYTLGVRRDAFKEHKSAQTAQKCTISQCGGCCVPTLFDITRGCPFCRYRMACTHIHTNKHTHLAYLAPLLKDNYKLTLKQFEYRLLSTCNKNVLIFTT